MTHRVSAAHVRCHTRTLTTGLRPLLLLGLAGCADKAPVDAPATASPAPVAALPQATPAHTGAPTIDCGARRYTLARTDNGARVDRIDGDAPRALDAPVGMDGYAPVGLGCAVAADDTPYLVVEYGEIPGGCQVCEWFFVYDADGAPLNESVPAMQVDGETRTPNNDGYARLLETLGLSHPQIAYLPPLQP